MSDIEQRFRYLEDDQMMNRQVIADQGKSINALRAEVERLRAVNAELMEGLKEARFRLMNERRLAAKEYGYSAEFGEAQARIAVTTFDHIIDRAEAQG